MSSSCLSLESTVRLTTASYLLVKREAPGEYGSYKEEGLYEPAGDRLYKKAGLYKPADDGMYKKDGLYEKAADGLYRRVA